jgi:hypothetical protein
VGLGVPAVHKSHRETRPHPLAAAAAAAVACSVAMKVFPSQNLALSTVKSKAMGNGQYTFWMDGSATGVPAAIDPGTGSIYYTAGQAAATLQICLDLCTNSNLCIGATFGAYNLANDQIAVDSCRLIKAKVQVGSRAHTLCAHATLVDALAGGNLKLAHMRQRGVCTAWCFPVTSY